MGNVSHPGHVSVGPNQNGDRSCDRPDCRKLPRTTVISIDHLNAICPWSHGEAVRLTEIEEHRPSIVQRSEDPQRTRGGDKIKIGHAAPEQRVPLAEIVMNVQT